MTTDPLQVQKVRHPIKMRRLTVKRVADLNSSMRRITLTGDDLAGFLSASFDDHLKLLVPEPAGVEFSMPTVGPTGLVFEEGRPRPVMRDYTPRRYDAGSNELDIDFVLGHEGPATDWASQAAPGHTVGIAGPRGSFVIPAGFAWHLLIGDETALPAIGRRLEELPETVKAIVVVKTATDDARIALSSRCALEVQWVGGSAGAGSGAAALEHTVEALVLPEGDGYAWAAGEYSEIKAVRGLLTDRLGIDRGRIRAASYWRKSAAATHEHFD
jgi:NADPH-dependent ferric siderophore reductase